MIILRHEGLEKTLLSNWTKILDHTKLMVFVLENVRDQQFNPVDDTPPKRNAQIALSRFAWSQDGEFEIWIDFTVPNEQGTSVGTCEAKLLLDGTIVHQRTTGVLFLQ